MIGRCIRNYLRILHNKTTSHYKWTTLVLCMVFMIIVVHMFFRPVHLKETFTDEFIIKVKPHIVFIVADDLGFNDVGYHGSEISTPTLNRLAQTGVRLENYYVQPDCTSTRSQLLSGRYQIYTGLQSGNILPGEPRGLPLDSQTMADKLKEAGYSTHMVGKWHLGYHTKEYIPTSRGFDSFFGFLNGYSNYFTRVTTFKALSGFDFMENNKRADLAKYNGTYSTHLFASKAIDIIERHKKNKPLFLYLPFQAPHHPLQVPEQYLQQYGHINDPRRRTYAGMVSCLDEAVRNITDAMKEAGMWDNTLLIFTTDNGGNTSAGGDNLPLRGTKGKVWEGGIRAVGFVHSKLLNQRKIGSVSRDLIHVTDWFPTLVMLAGGNFDGIKTLDGYNQWQTINGVRPSRRDEILIKMNPLSVAPGLPLFNNTFDTRIGAALRMGDWKIITGFPANGPRSRNWKETRTSIDTDNLWLFNIRNDPNENNDLSDTYPRRIQHMLNRLEHYQNLSVSVINSVVDSNADPGKHNGFWGPWQ